MKVLKKPKFIFIIFLFLFLIAWFIVSAFLSFSVSLSNSAAKEYYNEIYGDYVVSPVVPAVRRNQNVIGIAPERLSESAVGIIDNANAIISDLNGISGIKAMGAQALPFYENVLFINAPSIPRYWYYNSTFETIEKKLKKDNLPYWMISERFYGDVLESLIYAVNGEDLVNFYDGENSYEFYGMTGEKGVYIPDNLKESLQLTDDSKSILVLASQSQTNTQNPLSIPIAGYFHVPDKEVPDSTSASYPSYRKNVIFIFLDMEYYRQLFNGSLYSIPDNFDSLTIEEALKSRNSVSKRGEQDFGNIWIRSSNKEPIKQALNNSVDELAIQTSYEASVIPKNQQFESNFLYISLIASILMTLIVFGLSWTLPRRLIDYDDETINLLYLLGEKKSSIFMRLFKNVTIPLLGVAVFSLFLAIGATYLFLLKTDVMSIARFTVLFTKTTIIGAIIIVVATAICCTSLYTQIATIVKEDKPRKRDSISTKVEKSAKQRKIRTGQIRLLCSFKKYFSKYLIILILFALIAVSISLFFSAQDNMLNALYYHEKNYIKAQAVLLFTGTDKAGGNIRTTFPEEELTPIIRTALKQQKEITSFSFVPIYNPVKICLANGNECIYLNAYPSEKLKGNEFLTFKENLINSTELTTVINGYKYPIKSIEDDKLAENLSLSFFEAYLSMDLYNEIFALENGGDFPQFLKTGQIGFTYEGNLDKDQLVNFLLSNIGRGNYTIRLINRNDGRSLNGLYTYDNKTKTLYDHPEMSLIRNMYSLGDLTSFMDIIFGPITMLSPLVVFIFLLVILISFFVTISIFDNRQREFTMYSNLGASKTKIRLLILIEDFILLITTVLIGVLMIVAISVLLRVLRPLGQQLVLNEPIFYRDWFTINGYYSLEGIGLEFAKYIGIVAIFFTGVTLLINYFLLKKNDKERNSI